MNDTMKVKRTSQKKTHKTISVTAVQGTNDNSIVSKLSAVTQLYTKDNYLKYVVKKPCRRAPLINRGYYIRTKAMDHVFQSFLKYYSSCSQIVNLGAGFDMTYFRLCDQGLLDHCTYYEVDFPEVMIRKSSLIQCEPQLMSLLNNVKLNPADNIVLTSLKYKLLGVDLADLDLLKATLAATGFNSSIPTLFVSEVVLCYLTPESSSKVIEWAAAAVKHGVFLSYEQIYPDDAFGRVMTRHFETIGSCLRTIRSYPTLQDQIQRYQNRGWTYTQAMDVNYFFHHIVSEVERGRIYHLEPFDEFEEWHLKCMHYMILTAFNGECIMFADHLWAKPKPTNSKSPLDGDTKSLEYNSVHLENIVRSSCGDTMDCRDRVRQWKRTVLPEDKYIWSDIYNKERSCTSCDKRFGHTSNAVIFVKTQSLPNQSSSTTHRNFSDLSQDSDSHRTAVPENDFHTMEQSVSSVPDDSELTHILCLGGFGEHSSQHGRLSTVQAMLAETGNAFEVQCNGDLCSFDRMHHTATNLSLHRLVIFGGRFSPSKPCDTTSVCVISCIRTEDDKLCCQCEVIKTTGDIPCPRWRHSATYITQQGKGSVLVHGGRTEHYSTLNDVYLLDIATWSWSKVEAQGTLPKSSHSHTMDLWKNNILITGGLTEDETALATVHKLKLPQTAEEPWVWSKVSLTGNFRPRYSHTSAVVGDQLFVIGGVSFCYPPPGVTVIDLLSSNVQEYEQCKLELGSVRMLHKHTCVPLNYEDKTCIYIVGGGGNCFSFGTHLNDGLVLFSIKHSKNK